jgi:hypothetical protein
VIATIKSDEFTYSGKVNSWIVNKDGDCIIRFTHSMFCFFPTANAGDIENFLVSNQEAGTRQIKFNCKNAVLMKERGGKKILVAGNIKGDEDGISDSN